jgi:PAS domain S-box-containing protein
MDIGLALTLRAEPLTRIFSVATACIVVGGLTLVERRGRGKLLDSKQQIEIRTLLDTIPDLVVIVDCQGEIVDANGAAARLIGLPRHKLIGMPVIEFARIMNGDPGNVVQFPKSIATRALEGEAVGEERRRVRHLVTGEEVDLLVSANPIRNDKGEVKGALVIARDVSELTDLQKRLADIERHQAIGHVAAGIAHDFNNTLQTISQAAAVLQMGGRGPADQKYFLEMIQTAVRRGAEVIARIRDYLRSGTAARTEVDVRGVMEEAQELTLPLLRSKSIELQKELKSSGLVQGNRADLLRMFTNLIINSIQAMPGGGKIILGCEDQGNAVHAWVCDTGQGILPEVRNRIFNPYFTTKEGGTGLGLSGAQKIMLELGGNISFSSEPNKGTQFDLTFPKAAQEEERKTA